MIFLMSDFGKRYRVVRLVFLVSVWHVIYASGFPYSRNLLASGLKLLIFFSLS